MGTKKDEMTEAQKRDWLCSTSHRARTQPSFIPVPWCTSKWMSTDLPCVNWRQTGHMIEPLCVLHLNPLVWMWSFVHRVWCFRTETASGSKTCCLWKYHSFLSHVFLSFFFFKEKTSCFVWEYNWLTVPFLFQGICSLVIVVVWGSLANGGSSVDSNDKECWLCPLSEGTVGPRFVLAVVGRACTYSLFISTLQTGLRADLPEWSWDQVIETYGFVPWWPPQGPHSSGAYLSVLKLPSVSQLHAWRCSPSLPCPKMSRESFL